MTAAVGGPRSRLGGGSGSRTGIGAGGHHPEAMRGQVFKGQFDGGSEGPDRRHRLSWHIPAAVLLLLLGVVTLSGAGRSGPTAALRQQLVSTPGARLAGAGRGAGLSGATRLRSGAGGSATVAEEIQEDDNSRGAARSDIEPSSSSSSSSTGAGPRGGAVVLLPKRHSGATTSTERTAFAPPDYHCIPPEWATDWKAGSNTHRQLRQAPGESGSRDDVAGASSSSNNSSSSSSSSSSIDGGDSSSLLTVALVNDVSFHDEVTLGLAAALQGHRSRLRVYLKSAALKSGAGGRGLAPYFRSKLPGTVLVDAYDKKRIEPADVAILVSPEFNVDYAREFIAAARPRLVLVFIHEPNMAMNRLRYLVSLHPFTGISTLSPHVAKALGRRLNSPDIHWMLPTVAASCDAGCAEGFAVQGKFEATRRTYDTLWEAMLQLPTSTTSPPPRINIVGSGALSALQLPQELSDSVAVYRGLPYGQFFDTLCRSIAILPLFNEASGYLRDKISSSVLASLSAGTPLLVPEAFLATYSYLTPDHVLLMEPGESEAAAMARLMASPSLSAILSARRAAVDRLRYVLNHQAASKLDALIAAARGKPRHAGKYPPGGGERQQQQTRQQQQPGAAVKADRDTESLGVETRQQQQTRQQQP